jgi:hypothetical protein
MLQRFGRLKTKRGRWRTTNRISAHWAGVIFGLYRYWYVVEGLDGGESPTDAVLTDLPLAIAIMIWVGVCIVALAH